MSDRVQISKRLLLVNSVSSAVTRILNAAVLVWVLQYLVRRITPQELEIYPLVMSVMAVIPIFTSAFTWALSRYVTEAYAQDNDRRVTQITSTMFVVLACVGLALMAAGLVVVRYVDDILRIAEDRVGEARFMFMLLFGLVVVRLVVSPFAVGIFVRQRFIVLNFIEIAGTLVRIFLLAVLLFGLGPRVVWLVVAQVAAFSAVEVTKVVISLRMLPALRFDLRQVDWSIAGRLIGFNSWSVLNQLAWFIHDSMPPYLLNRLGTSVDVSTLGIGAIADVQIRSFVQSVTNPLLPVLTTMQATNQVDRLRASYLRGCRLTYWLILQVVVCVAVFRDELVHLIIRDKAAIYPDLGLVVALLLGAYVFYLPRVMLLKIAIALERIGPVILCNFASQVCNLALMLYLVGARGMGARGSAYSVVLIEVVWHFLFWWPLTLRIVEATFRRVLMDTYVRGLAPAAVCGVCCEVLRLLFSPSSFMGVGSCVAAGLVAYTLTLFGACLTASDRHDLSRVKQAVIAWLGPAENGGTTDP